MFSLPMPRKSPRFLSGTGDRACQKSLFDKLSNANRGAGVAFEKAARCGAHNLCAACAQIPHLPGVGCFVRDTRPRTKLIHTLFRRARRNSTRFFDKLSRGAAAPLLFHFPRTAKNGRSERKFQKTVAVLRKIWYTDKLDRDLARRDEARCGLTAFTATPDSRSG